MTLKEILTQIKEGMERLPSDDVIVEFLNECQDDLLPDLRLEESATDTSVDGTQEYDEPSDLYDLQAVLYDGDELEIRDLRYIRENYDDWDSDEDTPEVAYRYDGKIGLVPIPDTDGNTITFYYYKIPTELNVSSQSTTPDIPSRWHRLLVYYGRMKVYERIEEFPMASYWRGRYEEGKDEMISEIPSTTNVEKRIYGRW